MLASPHAGQVREGCSGRARYHGAPPDRFPHLDCSPKRASAANFPVFGDVHLTCADSLSRGTAVVDALALPHNTPSYNSKPPHTAPFTTRRDLRKQAREKASTFTTSRGEEGLRRWVAAAAVQRASDVYPSGTKGVGYILRKTRFRSGRKRGEGG